MLLNQYLLYNESFALCTVRTFSLLNKNTPFPTNLFGNHEKKLRKIPYDIEKVIRKTPMKHKFLSDFSPVFKQRVRG